MADLGRQLADLLYGESQQPKETTGQKIARRLTGAGETAATIGTGLLGSVPAGLAGLTQLIPTRGRTPDVNRAAQKVEDVQSALTYLPRTETGQRYLQNTAGALETLGAPAEYLGEKALQYTGSPGVATAANVLLDPVNFIGLPGSGKATVAATKAAGRAAAAAPRVAGEMVGDLLTPASRFESQRGAIKMKGGNWLAGEVEGVTKPLKINFPTNYDEALILGVTPNLARAPEFQYDMAKAEAINNWVDKKLNRYIKNEMATPEDPVRKLADRGITHMQGLDQNEGYVGIGLKERRKAAGLPEAGLGESRLAKNWEVKADQAIYPQSAGTLSDPTQWFAESAPDFQKQLEANPWLAKLPPETPVFETTATAENFDRMLGFDHLIDELKNSINPASDLPARLRWKPEDLEKVTMEQAVKRVHDINEYRAAKKAEANEVLARNPATVDFKTYETVPGGTEPNKMGLAWKEIKSPGAPAALPQGWELMPEKMGLVRAKDAEGNVVIGNDSADLIRNIYYRHPDTPGNPKQALADALKYEGDVMGHCVGGYCDDVLSGRTQIYSLRDKKGEPHVTIEVRPTKLDNVVTLESFLGKDRAIQLYDEFHSLKRNGELSGVSFETWLSQNPETAGLLQNQPPEIIQIKGKGNRAPKEEYLPFVQDFVRSGQWSFVRDMQNAGMRPTSSVFSDGELKMLRDLGETNIPAALSGVDIQRLHNLINPEGKRLIYDARGNIVGDETRRGYADGGAVMPAAEIGGGEFVRVAEKYGLGSDNATLNRIVQLVNKGMSLDQAAKKLASKSRVRISDNPDTMRLELANGGAVGQERSIGSKLVGGGVRGAGMRAIFGMDLPEDATKAEREVYANVTAMANTPGPWALAAAPAALVKGAKGAKAVKAAKEEAERSLPLILPRAPAKSKEEIAAHAERVGRQMLGEHVTSGKPGDTKNLAGRSRKENERIKRIEYELEAAKAVPESQVVQSQIGDINVAFPGDYSLSDVYLKTLEGEPIGSLQQGGSRFGLGKLDMKSPLFWASNEGPAQMVQNKITEVADVFNPNRVIGQHLAMGRVANNFAQHFADASLRAIDYSKVSRNDMELFDTVIAAGYEMKNPKTGERVQISFPEWPGIADPEGALAAMKKNPELRKWFLNRMKTPKLTQATNMPNGLDIEWAITSPDLRNMEVNLTGHSVGELVPGAKLTDDAAHETYSKGIRGRYLGHQEALTPFVLSFPDATQHILRTQRPQDFTGTIQKVFPHQIVDQQYLDELGEYKRRLDRVILGKKNGGEVKMQAGGAIKAATKAVKPSAEQAAKMVSQQAEMALKNRAMQELRAQFEDLPLGQQPQGWMSPERLQQKIEEIRRREATPVGGQIPLMQAGGAVKAAARAAKAAAKEVVLPAAERDANLAKLLEPSRVRQRLYHGTMATEGGKGQEAIRTLKPSKEGSLGSGVYLTPSPNFANQYADPFVPGSTGVASGNVLPVYAQIKNPLIIDGSASNDPMIEALMRLGMGEQQAARLVERAYENRGYIGKEVETRARAKGYDGLLQYDKDGELSEVVSYNPNAIKSAIGNRGTFDVSKPELSKKKGGKVKFTDNLDAMRLAVQKRK